MGGGLMQLVAYGAQDIYLTGNPQITFFKVVYRRHTNFAMESIQQTFNGVSTFGKRSTVIVSRNGDLINSAYIQVVLPSLPKDLLVLNNPSPVSPEPTALLPDPSDELNDGVELVWTNYVGLALIDYVTVEIGGQEIDKHYGLYMYLWQELTMTSEKSQGYQRMVGGNDGGSGWLLIGNSVEPQLLTVPLDFWFNINAGLSLPLIALQYHEVRFIFQFQPLENLVQAVQTVGPEAGRILKRNTEWRLSNNGLLTQLQPTIDMFIDYIYLDTDERRRFAQMSHEYLIDQVQHNETTVNLDTADRLSQRLTFNHPCKELFWVFRRVDNVENNDQFNFSSFPVGEEKLGGDLLQFAVLRLNGHYRFNPARGPLFFRQWQPFIHHTRIPDSNLYVYSFALRPEEHQPSGTCNFSRIDNTILEYGLDTRANFVSPVLPGVTRPRPATGCLLNVFARNYNVLRIMSGMGGLAYSN
jgi:hypothetical protein